MVKSFNTFITEDKIPTTISDHLDHFIEFACEELGLNEPPLITLINDKALARENHSFGGYHPASKEIRVNIAERHRADVFRTLAHELTHYKQDLEDRLHEASGDTGSDEENEANAMAGIIMRNYAKANDGLFEGVETKPYYVQSTVVDKKGARSTHNATIQGTDKADVKKRHAQLMKRLGLKSSNYQLKENKSPEYRIAKSFDKHLKRNGFKTSPEIDKEISYIHPQTKHHVSILHAGRGNYILRDHTGYIKSNPNQLKEENLQPYCVHALVHNRISGKTVQQRFDCNARDKAEAEHLHDLHMAKTPGFEVVSRHISLG